MSAFDDIYAKYVAQLFAYALKCVGRRDVAEDITSEVFLTLHKNFSAIDITQLRDRSRVGCEIHQGEAD